jgi:hypothetical protein
MPQKQAAFTKQNCIRDLSMAACRGDRNGWRKEEER